MSLFIVKAQHSPDTCPAGDPQMGAMLLQHLSKDNAGKSGINIQASAGVEGQHTLNLILEASDSQKVEEFLAPFAQMGTVEIMPAITCEAIVARGRC